MLVREGYELDLVRFLPVDSHLSHVPAGSEGSEQRSSKIRTGLKIDMMVAGNEPLDCEDLVRGESTENVGNPQRLRVTVEDNIGSSNSAECYQGLLFVSVPVNVGPEKEAVR